MPVEDLQLEAMRRIGERANMSQAIFALVLDGTASLVSKRERREKKPSRPLLKFFSLTERKGIEAIL